jgi:hypothetical protein
LPVSYLFRQKAALNLPPFEISCLGQPSLVSSWLAIVATQRTAPLTAKSAFTFRLCHRIEGCCSFMQLFSSFIYKYDIFRSAPTTKTRHHQIKVTIQNLPPFFFRFVRCQSCNIFLYICKQNKIYETHFWALSMEESGDQCIVVFA